MRYPLWLWWLIKLVLRPFTTAWIHSHSRNPGQRLGRESLPTKGGLLLVVNHISDLDPILVQWASSRPVHFMAKQSLFEMRGLGRLIRIFQAFPVRPNSADRKAIRRAIDLLRAGECVCIFPEGQLSRDGRLQPLNHGYELIARQSGAQIAVGHIRGANQILPYGTTRPIRCRIQISVHWQAAGSVEDVPRTMHANDEQL